MSSASRRSQGKGRRASSIPQDPQLRGTALSRLRVVQKQDAYLYALRVAFLAYLLQPRAKRMQHVAAPPKAPVQRSSTSINDMVKDFALIRDSKSTRFPHGFMTELDKRITGVLIGKEKMPEYNDALVKRTFAVFLNEFKEQKFRKNMEKDRRVEDLLLIFFAQATKELQKGKPPEDDSWKLMVDRHVALFIRLISSTLKDHDWARDRPELSSRLQTLESKLLAHDQDLAAASHRNGGAGGTTIEVEVPRSYELRDMPLAMTVSRLFEVSYSQVQSDINKYRIVWTEKAALQDLKAYQANLSLETNKTLSSEDFDTEEAYEVWKKGETQDLSQMMLVIIQSNPELAKTTGGTLPQLKPANGSSSDSGYSDLSRKMSGQSDNDSAYVTEQSIDLNNLTLDDGFNRRSEDSGEDGNPYVFIPPDPRAYYRAVLKHALEYDLNDQDLASTEATVENQSRKLLSKQSTELLTEVRMRWRVPQFSTAVLFLDVVKEMFENHQISLETLDNAFSYVREIPMESKKANRMSIAAQQSLFDRSRWTISDFVLNQHILAVLHDALLRELYELLQHCYEKNFPSIGPVMWILNSYIYDDPIFSPTHEAIELFTEELNSALRERAAEKYRDFLAKEIPAAEEQWEFYHVIQLGKSVVKLAEKIQKRYRKNPDIMGANPLMIFVQEVFPAFAADARDLIARIVELAKSRSEEIPVQDGFELYKELVDIRRVHAETLPNTKFDFHIEEILADFVWRWIQTTDESIPGWVDGAVKHDNFAVRIEHPGNIASDDERHSVSVVDIFRSFNQAVDQIAGLNWDDDLQYAKFMTSLSKSIGTGIAKYCELLDQKFSKEMDRMLEQEPAVTHQTRQEKWMQMAKEAWATKERVEPFQFLPESLVKLNDIEYAILQLDKLEKDLNVDACAEVIQRYAPPLSQRVRKTDTYVFTIKIIEAEDLKACDMNGLSDPYVVLGDEYQKRLAKTRIVYGSLNPRWDETVDITTKGPLNIIATIWDWDALGDHDCVGRTSLKLDPSHFRDYMPREYWLDLDTQGRLLLRVSMEGERDDIQFYFGKAFRTLKRTERDMTRKITDKLSAYICHCLSLRALRSLLSRGSAISSVSSYFQRNRPQSVIQPRSQAEVISAIQPLLEYFDENFAIFKQTLTESAMITVMTRLWKEVLATIESLLVPPLSDKPSAQRPLSQQELDIVFKWLEILFKFFNAVDEETGIAQGVPADVLRSPKYHELKNLNFFYFEPTENLIRTSEAISASNAARQQEQAAKLNRSSAPVGAGALLALPSTRRSKSVMLSRNLGTMKKAKEEKRKEAQAEPSDDIILRILRMRPEAQRYLTDRQRQKQRLAAAAQAELIVRQSLMNSSGGRMTGGNSFR